MAPSRPASSRLVLIDTRLATMAGTGAPYGLIEDGAVVVENGRITWAGPASELSGSVANGARRVACDGRLLTPGLIDCHTHLVYGGDRAGEFEMRLTGVPYAEIARRGGGIVSTVKATRAADEAALYEFGLKRLDALLSEGVTTVEIKSGYGLDTASEMKMLRVGRRLGAARPVTVVTSFLGAHAVPPECRDRRDDYVALVTEEMIPAVAGESLADAVDGFCETIAFSPEEMARVFDAAAAHGLPVKLHAEQLSNLGGAALAARYGAMSADHLEYLDEPGIAAMAQAGTVAVLLPGAFYYLGETQLPPVAGLREAGVPIAVATDLNPGSSPVHSLLTAMNMACVLFRLTPEEALKGATVNAARALRLDDRGMIVAGMRADLCLWEVEHPAALAYTLGYNPLAAALKDGKPVRGGLVL